MASDSQRAEAVEDRVRLASVPCLRRHSTRRALQGSLKADVWIEQSEAGSTGFPDLGDSIDQVTFEQILEMDDDEDEREFSRSIVYGFFEQAETTFKKMETAL